MRQLGIGEHHAADSDEVHMAEPHLGLGNQGQVVLEIGESCADHGEVRHGLLAAGGHVEQAGASRERILRGRVPIGRREVGGPLDVGVVVRTSARNVHEGDPQLPAELQKPHRFSQVHFEGIVGIHPERVPVWKVRAKINRDPSGALAWRRVGEGNEIEGGEADGQVQARHIPPDGRADLAQEAGPVLQASPVRSGPRVVGGELVAQGPVAVLDIHEVEPDLGRELGRGHVILHQVSQLRI